MYSRLHENVTILFQSKYRTTYNTDPNLVACALAINIISLLLLKVTMVLLRNANESFGRGWMAAIQFPWKDSVDQSSYYVQTVQGPHYLG
jgi:hypothetical protein